ncbi:unnamed protein product [Musa acuminata subsp. malaccensis]|uniref:(wild Malaysian banana) hypothetical protein n=1 Tax=Musa acuminata subsp. malaccensis TaxID=214687 RepID=A0A804LAP0_MUSAM|nr:unnamed protein product [Musa acuminata subsp. malaccensis]
MNSLQLNYIDVKQPYIILFLCFLFTKKKKKKKNLIYY